MIKIFDANDTIFNTNGNIVIKPLKLLEVKKKSLNGWYIEVEIPIKYKEYIKQDKLCVVKTKSKLKPQAFRIDNPEYGQRKISFTANHVMFDSKDYFLEDVRPTNLNGLNALKYINERTDKTSPFTILSSDVETLDTCYFIRKNLFEAWEVIEERYGGVFDADNFDISFKTAIGVDRGEIIAYGKNLQNIKIFENWSNVCTKLYPVGKDGLLLESKYITSDIQYDKPYTKTVSFESELDEEEQTEENLLNELLVKATNYLQENKYPQVSYEITSDINQLVEIGDKIHVKHPLANILTEVLEYEFNGITKKVKKLVFGNYVRDVKTKFDSIKNSIEKVVNELSGQAKIINEQTDLINSLNKNGYVYIDDNEILILDELPKENAKNVWRFGLGGIGFSSTGYQGPFSIAMTADGKINADFISTGTLAASRVEGYNDLVLSVSNITSTLVNDYTSNDELDQKLESQKNTITNEMNTQFNQTAQGITIDIMNKIAQDGVSTLKNTMITIDEKGITTAKNDEDVVSLLDNIGLYVSDGVFREDETNVLMKVDRDGGYLKTLEVKSTIKEQDIIQKEVVEDEDFGICQSWYWIGSESNG